MSATPLFPNYIVQFDNNRGEHYLYNPYSGECIFGVDEHGQLTTSLNRNVNSCWTRPTMYHGSTRLMRDDVTAQRVARDLVYKKSFPPSKSIYDEDVAIRILQTFCRRIRDVAVYRRKIFETYEKHYDESSFLFFFTNLQTNKSIWHRPIGLGQSAENDIPAVETEMVEYDADGYALEFYEEKKDGEGEGEGEGEGKDDDDDDENENVLGFPAIKDKYKGKSKFLFGPYCKRRRGKPGRRVNKALGNSKLKSASLIVDKFGRTGFDHPRAMDIEGCELYGENIPALDGLAVKDVQVEPYMLIRAAHERGPQECINMMEVSERAKRASLDEDENTRDESREMATDGYIRC